MLQRRKTAFAAVTLLTLGATLTGCGFHYPTDKVNQISAGANDRTSDVDALGIRIVSGSEGTGRLIGALANNTTDAASLDTVTAPSGDVTAAFDAIEVAPRGGVNLATDDGPMIQLTGAPLLPGKVVDLELSFSTGESVVLAVPVVKPCFQYADIALDGGTTDKGDAAAEDVADTAEATGAYLCADEIPAPGEAH